MPDQAGVVDVASAAALDGLHDDGTAPLIPPSAADAGSRRFWLLLGLLVLAALVLRVDVVRNVAPPVPALGDAHAYHVLGTNLADGRGYIRPYDFERAHQSVPSAEYPPALPVVLAVATKLGARSTEAQRIVLCGLGSLTVLLVGLAGRRLGGPNVGLVAATLAAGYPMLWASDAALMSETLAALAGAAVLLLALAARESSSWGPWLGLGVLLGASALVRSEGLLLAPLLVVPLAWRAPLGRRAVAAVPPATEAAGAPGAAGDLEPDRVPRSSAGERAGGRSDGEARRRVALGAIALVAAGAVVLPWTVRNWVTFHRLVPVSNNVGSVARGANCDLAYRGQYRGLWVTDVGDLAGGKTSSTRAGCFAGFPITAGVDEAAAAARLRADGLSYARHHLGDLPGVMAVRVGRTLGLTRFTQQTAFAGVEGRSVLWERRGTRMFQLLALLAIGGAVVMWRRRGPLWPFVAPVVTVLVTTALTYGNQRFRAAAEPVVIVLAAYALAATSHAGRRQSRGNSAPNRSVIASAFPGRQ
ncbi:MAG: hypothetical protein JWN46_506 [Acidimicrobiales bacterium]|nr:hypothetical protein [Acidimicrobiales bacterium]